MSELPGPRCFYVGQERGEWVVGWISETGYRYQHADRMPTERTAWQRAEILQRECPLGQLVPIIAGVPDQPLGAMRMLMQATNGRR